MGILGPPMSSMDVAEASWMRSAQETPSTWSLMGFR